MPSFRVRISKPQSAPHISIAAFSHIGFSLIAHSIRLSHSAVRNRSHTKTVTARSAQAGQQAQASYRLHSGRLSLCVAFDRYVNNSSCVVFYVFLLFSVWCILYVASCQCLFGVQCSLCVVPPPAINHDALSRFEPQKFLSVVEFESLRVHRCPRGPCPFLFSVAVHTHFFDLREPIQCSVFSLTIRSSRGFVKNRRG